MLILYVGQRGTVLDGLSPFQHLTDGTEHCGKVCYPSWLGCAMGLQTVTMHPHSFLVCLTRAGRQTHSFFKQFTSSVIPYVSLSNLLCTSSVVWWCPFQYLLQYKTWPGLTIIQNWIENDLLMAFQISANFNNNEILMAAVRNSSSWCRRQTTYWFLYPLINPWISHLNRLRYLYM